MSDMMTIEIEGGVSSGKSPVAQTMKSYLESTGKRVALCDHMLFKNSKFFDRDYATLWDVANDAGNDVYIVVIGTIGEVFKIKFDKPIMANFFPATGVPFFNEQNIRESKQ